MEKYYSIGQYNYCMGNPVKYIDPNGEDVWELDNKGNIINYIETDEEVAFYMVKNVDGEWQRTGDKLEFGQGTKITQKTYTYASDDNTVRSYDVYQVRGDENGTTLFEFLADNITGSSSQVEMGQIMTGVEGDKGLNFITTSHTKNKEASIKYMINKQIQYGYTVREINHSHTANPAPSMNDIIVATQVIDAYKARGLHVPQFYIYHVPSRQKVSFGHQ